MATTNPASRGREEALRTGLDAIVAGDWVAARTAYRGALEDGESAEALEGFATASWWLDDVAAAIDARERAYALRRAQGDTGAAALLAALLAWDHGAMRGATAVASGWLQRARRLTADLPPSAEQAWLPLIEASFHLDTDATAVLRLSTEALDHAIAHDGLDVEMTARTLQGLALVTLGRCEEGNRLLDEGVAAATSGELSDPLAIGSCCCNMLIACERTRDYDRAAQWCEQLAAFGERTGQRPLLALCRAHHGTVLTMWGEWTDAEGELDRATGELATLRPPLAGYARARFAELRRRQGRRVEADALLAAAGTHVLTSLVRAELAFDDDEPASALDLAERYLRAFDDDHPLDAAGALELLVPVHLRLDRRGEAHLAHERLAELADGTGTVALRAAERSAAGTLALAGGDAVAAQWAHEEALAAYEAIRTPYEVALAHLSLARALAAGDRRDAAREQAALGLEALEGLGARRAARDARRLLDWLGGRRAGPGELTPREAEVLVLVAEGLSNPQIAQRLVVSEHTVHRHLANIFNRLGVSSRAAAVAVGADRGLLG